MPRVDSTEFSFTSGVIGAPTPRTIKAPRGKGIGTLKSPQRTCSLFELATLRLKNLHYQLHELKTGTSTPTRPQ